MSSLPSHEYYTPPPCHFYFPAQLALFFTPSAKSSGQPIVTGVYLSRTPVQHAFIFNSAEGSAFPLLIDIYHILPNLRSRVFGGTTVRIDAPKYCCSPFRYTSRTNLTPLTNDSTSIRSNVTYHYGLNADLRCWAIFLRRKLCLAMA